MSIQSITEKLEVVRDLLRYGRVEPALIVVRDALAALSQQPVTPVPMTEFQRGNLVIEHLGPEALAGGRISVLDAFILGITAAEAHHGIKTKEQA